MSFHRPLFRKLAWSVVFTDNEDTHLAALCGPVCRTCLPASWSSIMQLLCVFFVFLAMSSFDHVGLILVFSVDGKLLLHGRTSTRHTQGLRTLPARPMREPANQLAILPSVADPQQDRLNMNMLHFRIGSESCKAHRSSLDSFSFSQGDRIEIMAQAAEEVTCSS